MWKDNKAVSVTRISFENRKGLRQTLTWEKQKKKISVNSETKIRNLINFIRWAE